MAAKNNSNLFFTCSLIEFIGRKMKQKRNKIVDFLGKEVIAQIYDYADVFHCEPIEKVADEFTEKSQMTKGDFDNVAECQYHVPDYWTIGEVYHSWISDSISDYNTDFYFQPRDYIAACYECGLVLE